MIIQILLFSVSICTDAFVASLAYGAGGIRIPLRSAAVIGGVGSCVLGVAVAGSGLIARILPPGVPAALGAILLLLIGAVTLCESTVKRYLEKRQQKKRLRFKLAGIQFMLEVYLDETRADRDQSKALSAKEALYLAAALSVDSLGAGLGLGLLSVPLLPLMGVAFLLGCAAVLGGHWLGGRVQKISGRDLSWLSGAILILLGALRLLAWA